MAPEEDLLDLVAREPDERLLDEDLGQLPDSLGRPEPLSPSPARRRVVAVGATMTGLTLVGGVALILFGLVYLLAGGSVMTMALALVLGIILVGTHWGWVHVAELTANQLEAGRNAGLLDRRRQWLGRIEPYPRWEVTTSVGPDGSITILTVCHEPVARGEGKFTFIRRETAREVHSSQEPAAAVTERAELVRRHAAGLTERERLRYQAARDAHQDALMAQGDERERLAALRAASEALSERINTNLRDPPLSE